MVQYPYPPTDIIINNRHKQLISTSLTPIIRGKSPELCCSLQPSEFLLAMVIETYLMYQWTIYIFMVILNLSLVCSEMGWNIVKRCIGTPWRAKTGPLQTYLEPDLTKIIAMVVVIYYDRFYIISTK